MRARRADRFFAATLLICAGLALAACPDRPAPEKPLPAGGLEILGRIEEKRGWCHTIRGDDGKLYAVHTGELGALDPPARVRVVGIPAARLKQDCPGAILIEIDRPVRAAP